MIEPKLEPMDEEMIQAILMSKAASGHEACNRYILSAILAYAHAKAEAERRDYLIKHSTMQRGQDDPWYWTSADWLNAVLERLGWRE